MTPEQFLEAHDVHPKMSITGKPVFDQHVVIEAMRLYAQHVAKEVRHKAAEIALMDDPEYRHRMIMNIKISDNARM